MIPIQKVTLYIARNCPGAAVAAIRKKKHWIISEKLFCSTWNLMSLNSVLMKKSSRLMCRSNGAETSQNEV